MGLQIDTPAGLIQLEKGFLMFGRRSDGVLVPVLVDNDGSVDTTASGVGGGATETTLAAMSAKLPAVLGQTTKNNSLAVVLASNDDIHTILGVPTGAAVITSVTGSLQQYLRGLVSLFGTLGAKTLDAGPAWTDVLGVDGAAAQITDATVQSPVTDAPTTGQKNVITDLIVSVLADQTLLFVEETTDIPIYQVFMAAKTTMNLVTRGKIKLPSVNKKLLVTGSAASAISVTALYHSEA